MFKLEFKGVNNENEIDVEECIGSSTLVPVGIISADDEFVTLSILGNEYKVSVTCFQSLLIENTDFFMDIFKQMIEKVGLDVLLDYIEGRCVRELLDNLKDATEEEVIDRMNELKETLEKSANSAFVVADKLVSAIRKGK